MHHGRRPRRTEQLQVQGPYRWTPSGLRPGELDEQGLPVQPNIFLLASGHNDFPDLFNILDQTAGPFVWADVKEVIVLAPER